MVTCRGELLTLAPFGAGAAFRRRRSSSPPRRDTCMSPPPASRPMPGRLLPQPGVPDDALLHVSALHVSGPSYEYTHTSKTRPYSQQKAPRPSGTTLISGRLGTAPEAKKKETLRRRPEGCHPRKAHGANARNAALRDVRLRVGRSVEGNAPATLVLCRFRLAAARSGVHDVPGMKRLCYWEVGSPYRELVSSRGRVCGPAAARKTRILEAMGGLSRRRTESMWSMAFCLW